MCLDGVVKLVYHLVVLATFVLELLGDELSVAFNLVQAVLDAFYAVSLPEFRIHLLDRGLLST